MSTFSPDRHHARRLRRLAGGALLASCLPLVLAGCDAFGGGEPRVEVVITADPSVYFVGEVTAYGTDDNSEIGGLVSVAELYGRNDNETPPDERVTIRTGYNERLATCPGCEGWRLDGVIVEAFTKNSPDPGTLRVELYRDGVLVDADEVTQQGASTREMRVGDVPSRGQ